MGASVVIAASVQSSVMYYVVFCMFKFDPTRMVNPDDHCTLRGSAVVRFDLAVVPFSSSSVQRLDMVVVFVLIVL